MDFNEFKERVRAANDITDIIGRYVSLKRSGSSFKGLCPFHNEKTPSFFVMPEDQYYYCHGCHKGGDVFTFLCDYNNLDFSEALEELARNAGIEMPEKLDRNQSGQSYKKGLKNRIFEMYKEAAGFYYEKLRSDEGKDAFRYLSERGISANMMTAFGLGYAPGGADSLYDHLKSKNFDDEELKESGLFSYKSGKPRDQFFRRVMYPIMTKSSRVIAFGGRVLGDEKPKYINSPETVIYSKKDNLYGIHRAIRAKNNRIILVEGYMDVIAVHQAGFPETLASLGTALTKEQAHIISGMASKVYLVYDADGAGKAAMLRAIPILRSEGLFVNVADMSPFKDPDELIKSEGAEGFERRIENAQNAFFFETGEFSKEFNLDDPSERAAFEAKTAERIAAFDNKFEREQYIETLADRFNIDKGLLAAEVSRIGNLKEDSSGSAYRVKESRGIIRKDTGENGINTDEKNVLRALISSPEYYDDVSRFISPEDFSPGIMRELAVVTFTGAAEGGITVAEIMGMFSGEESDTIGRVFFDEKYDISDEKERKCFVSDSVLSLLKRRIDEGLMNCTGDMQERYRALCARKKDIEKLNSIFI